MLRRVSQDVLRKFKFTVIALTRPKCFVQSEASNGPTPSIARLASVFEKKKSFAVGREKEGMGGWGGNPTRQSKHFECAFGLKSEPAAQVRGSLRVRRRIEEGVPKTQRKALSPPSTLFLLQLIRPRRPINRVREIGRNQCVITNKIGFYWLRPKKVVFFRSIHDLTRVLILLGNHVDEVLERGPRVEEALGVGVAHAAVAGVPVGGPASAGRHDDRLHRRVAQDLEEKKSF